MADNILLSLGLKTTNFQKGLQEASVAAATAAGKIAGKFDFKSVGTTLATALGLNLQNVAEQVARWFTGVSKEAEQQMQELAAISDQVAERQAARFRARMTEEQKYGEAKKAAASAEQAMADNQQRTQADLLRLEQDKLRWVNARTEIEAYERKQAEAERAASQKWIESSRENFRKLEEERGKARQARYDFEVESGERHRKEVEENAEILTLQAKSLHGLTEQEKERLEILKKQVQLRDNEQQIMSLLTLNSRTPEEEALLQRLIQQSAVLGTQIDQKGRLVDKTKDQVKTEEEVLRIRTQITRIGREDEALSDRELDRKIDLLQADISSREIALRGSAGLAGTSPSDPLLQIQQQSLARATQQRDYRTQVRNSVSFFGEDAAFKQFPQLTEQELSEIMRTATDSSRQTELLRDIARTLDQPRTDPDLNQKITRLTDATVAVAQQLNQRGISTGSASGT